jgi:hypothetical protein
MQTGRWIGLGVLLALVAFDVRAGGRRAFSDLELGDPEPRVVEKLRDHLQRGEFARACYGCPVHAKLGPHRLVLKPAFENGRLFQLRAVHSRTSDFPGEAESERVWALLLEVLEQRYGAPTSSSGFPELPSPTQVKATQTWETGRWDQPGKRVRLLVEQSVSYRRSTWSLRERVFAGWLPGRNPREDKVVEVRVVVEISDPVVAAEAQRHDAQDGDGRARLLERGLELF